MANYTAELRTIVESGFNIFNFPYSFYDEAKKTEFEQQFILHFKYKEICCYPVARWVDYLHDKFNTTLPYYNMLFRTALIDYEKTKNYNILETQSRNVSGTNQVTGNSSQNGTSNNTINSSNTLNRELDNVATGSKTNTLDSTTDHTESVDFVKDESVDESNTNTKNSTKSLDATKVNSDTPQAQLSIGDIKDKVYASQAEFNDNTETTKDTETNSAKKTDKNTENTDSTAKDVVKGTTKDSTTDTIDETVKETNTGNSYNSGSFGNATNSAQTTTDNQNETFTRTMSGSYGVITEADMLKKHIELQQTLSTIMNKFFDECEDLFMGVYEMEGI
jgi:hypothetical protein